LDEEVAHGKIYANTENMAKKKASTGIHTCVTIVRIAKDSSYVYRDLQEVLYDTDKIPVEFL
jgi:hypothetical protein